MRSRLFVIVVIGSILGLMGCNLWFLRDLVQIQEKILARQEEQREFLIGWSQVVPTESGTLMIQACMDGRDDPDAVYCSMPVFQKLTEP